MSTLLTAMNYNTSFGSQQTQMLAAQEAGMSSMPNISGAMSTLGPIMSIFGAINGAIGSYYATKSQQNQIKSQFMTMQYQADLSRINAGVAENAAQQTMLAGERQIGQLTMRAGKIRSARRASTAARGIALDVGSTAEVSATEQLMKEIDMLTLSANTVRAAEAQRMQKVNYLNQASLQDVSAQNLLTSASSISPTSAAFSSLISGASNFASNYFSPAKMRAGVKE